MIENIEENSLSIIFNHIDSGLVSKIWKFADDIKIARTIDTDHDREALQNDLNEIVQWTNEWQMQLNVAKCKVMKVGGGDEY